MALFGHYEAVIRLMGGQEYDETDLRMDLALQQEATETVVRIFQQVLERDVENQS